LFRLAGHLKMTVGELERRMDSKELSEWVAYTKHFEALPDSWRETGLVVAATLAPHSPKGRAPKSDDFVPLEKPPQHEDQMLEQLQQLNRILEAG
jgi:hypothetical protein